MPDPFARNTPNGPVESGQSITPLNGSNNLFVSPGREQYPSTVSRPLKSIIYSAVPAKQIDPRIIAQKYYNCFNFPMIERNAEGMKYTIGVTSPNDGEGKTLVACNLAVSLSLGGGFKTVLVDMNIHRPRVHEIFGTPSHPGLVDALHDGSIHVSPTRVDGLSVLSAGGTGGTALRLGDLGAFQSVLRTLEQDFQFIVVDMAAMKSRVFPLSFSRLLHGILLVVDAHKTRRRDVDRVFQQLSEDQILGFIFNRFNEESF